MPVPPPVPEAFPWFSHGFNKSSVEKRGYRRRGAKRPKCSQNEAPLEAVELLFFLIYRAVDEAEAGMAAVAVGFRCLTWAGME